MPLIKSKSRKAFVQNLKAEMAAGKPKDQALATAYSVKRRSKRAEGGSVFDWSGVGEAMPEHIGRENVIDPLYTIPKSMVWDLPHRAIDAAKDTSYGLRREDFTDVPPDYSPDPNSPLGGIGVAAPRGGWQPTDPLIGASLEGATNVMGGTALSAPAKAAGEFVAGAGPRDPALWHGISKVKLPKPIAEMSAVHTPASTFAERFINPADLQGSNLYPLIGDRTGAGTRLEQVNGYRFGTPVEMQGGHGFMPQNADTGAAWASGKGVVSRLGRDIRESGADAPVHGVYTAMGERSGDFSHHMSDTLAEMMQHVKVPKAARKTFDDEMKAMVPDWPGVNSPKLREYLSGAPGEVRSVFAKVMDTAKYQKMGFPSVAEARFATTDPRLLNEQTGASGLSIARMDPTGRTFPSQHGTYETNLAGQYVGGFPTSIPKEVMYPQITGPLEAYRSSLPGYKPTIDYLMQRTPKGLPKIQRADQQWVDTVSKHLEDRGFKLGAGATDRRAAAVAAADDILAQERKLAPAFYSHLSQTVEATPQPVMTGQEWLGLLSNRGVKADEMQFTGMQDYLASKANAPVTKAELAQHLGENKIQLGASTRGAMPPFEQLSPHQRSQIEMKFEELNGRAAPGERELGRWYDNIAEHSAMGRETALDPIMQPTKYSPYQLPGGENYRERLLTLPQKSRMTDAEAKQIYESTYRQGDESWEQLSPKDRQGWVDMFKSQNASREGYQSSHWDEPNVLAHRRTNEREFPIPFTAEEEAARNTRAAVQSQIEAIRQQQGEVARQINAMGKPLEKARIAAIIEDVKSGKITSTAEYHRRMEAPGEFPELVPLQDKLQALRAQEDNLRASLPPEPKQRSMRSLHIEEIQSDWHQAGRKSGYRSGENINDLVEQEKTALKKAWLEASGGLYRNYYQAMAANESGPEFIKMQRYVAASPEVASIRTKINAARDGVPDAPFKKNWHEIAVKDAIREAAERGINRISWTPGKAQADRYSLAKQIDELSVNPSVHNSQPSKTWWPKTKEGRGHDSIITDLDGKILQAGRMWPTDLVGKNISDVVGKDVAQKGLREGKQTLTGIDLEVGGEGMKGFYDKIIPDYLNKLGKPHGVKVQTGKTGLDRPGWDVMGPNGENYMTFKAEPSRAQIQKVAEQWNVPAESLSVRENKGLEADVHYMDIPQSLKDEALYKGFRLGAGATDRRAAGIAAADDVLDAERRLAGVTHEQAAVPAESAAATPAGEVGPGGGGAAGARSLPEAQATAARWAGARAPLEGIPGPLKIGDQHFVPGPIGKIHDVAEDYMRTVHPDRPYTPPTRYHPLDEEHSKAIAQAYEEMKHTPNDPATKASYDALIDETAKQYQAIKKTGLKIEPIPHDMPDPYAANPRMAAIDVAENNHLWFFPTEGGFGTVNKITDNPMLRKTGEKIGDHELLANDMFRIVHDYFGHLKEGHGFRAAGEDNAWRTHAQMYSDIARPAMTTETRGQNSNVNYSQRLLHEVIGERRAREIYGNEGRQAGAQSGHPQRGGISHSEGVPGVQSVARDDGPLLQSQESKLGELRGARDNGSSADENPAGFSGRNGAAADREASGRSVSGQQRSLRAGERSLGDGPTELHKSAPQYSDHVRGENPRDVGMGEGNRHIPTHAVGSSEQVRMDRGAGADASKVEPRWKTITVGEHNRKASAADTIYADQKVGLMPEWVMRDRGSPSPIMMYHGTPHRFSRFDISKIGEGEGNQAFGHGLYFAGHEPVSEWYRHQLATRQDPLLKKYKLADVGHVIGSHLSDAGGDAGKLAGEYAKLRQRLIETGPNDKATENMIKDYDRRIKYLNDPERATGHLYQVGADVDPQRLLDYDVPFKDQSQYVQGRVGPDMDASVRGQLEAIDRVLEAGGTGRAGSRFYRPLSNTKRQELEGTRLLLGQTGPESFLGKDIYKRLGLPAVNESEGSVKSAKRLLELEVPGMRYKDAGSRAPGQKGSHNYVMFSDDMLKILRRYGVVGIPAAGVLGADGEERRASGGAVNAALDIARKLKRAKGGKVHVGPIVGETDGRADEVPMEVPDGAYVLTADHCSAMGEGNTLAGFKKLNQMFPLSAKAHTAPRAPIKRASGGKVPIYAADGEYVICPEDIINRWGNLDEGHKFLDAWQTSERARHVETLKGLDPPAQD